jgi:hypothetical protein
MAQMSAYMSPVDYATSRLECRRCQVKIFYIRLAGIRPTSRTGGPSVIIPHRYLPAFILTGGKQAGGVVGSHGVFVINPAFIV